MCVLISVVVLQVTDDVPSRAPKKKKKKKKKKHHGDDDMEGSVQTELDTPESSKSFQPLAGCDKARLMGAEKYLAGVNGQL